MIVQPHSSRWQTVIADLSLILFLVCAAALQDKVELPAVGEAAAQTTPAPLETPVMMSVWSDVPGGPTLAQWLSEQPPDDSQRLSIEITYRAGGVAAAFARADALRLSAGTAGDDARVLIAQGPQDAVLAQLVQDDALGVIGAATGPNVAQQRAQE